MDPWEKINRLRASAQKDKAIYSKTVIYSPTRTHRHIPYMHIKFERREYGVSDGTIYQRRTRYSNCLINHITFSLLKTCEKRASGAPAREGREQRRGWGGVGWGGSHRLPQAKAGRCRILTLEALRQKPVKIRARRKPQLPRSSPGFGPQPALSSRARLLMKSSRA